MIKNYFLIALRILARQRGFTLINIGGLTIGMTCSMLLILFVQDELSFDQFHKDAERIYRVGFEGQLQGNPFRTTKTGVPLAKALQTEVPEIESTLRIASWKTFPVLYENKKYTEPYLLLADSNFFSFFNFTIIEGQLTDALTGKDKLVISESAARRYFNYNNNEGESPIGKQLILAQGYKATIVAVAKDAPANSHLHYSLILSLASWESAQNAPWMNGLVITYFKIKPGADIRAVEKKLTGFSQTYLKKETESNPSNEEEYRNQPSKLKFFIQRLKDIHLYSNLDDEIEENGKAEYVYLFGLIAVFITLLACINFVNLSTARAASRAKEVGVRKATGAHNSSLIFQFLFESYFFTIIALLLSLLFIKLGLYPFNAITGKELTSAALYHPFFIGGILCYLILVGLLSGFYPAFILTYLSPAQILKGQVRSGLTTYGVRNLLVTFQYVISISLIISTWVIYQQVRYMESHSVGFDNSNVINLLHTANLKENSTEFKKKVNKLAGVVSNSYSNRLPPNIDHHGIFRKEGSEKDIIMYIYQMDPDHLKTMGYKMASGRFFSDDPLDSTTIILNETAARKLKIDFEKPGQTISSYSPYSYTRKVIGVMQDFHFQSLKDSIQPLAILYSREPNWEMAIRIKPENRESTLKEIESLWHKYAPGAPFEFSFLKNNYQNNYSNEYQVATIFLSFALLAILIASLGLLGLATYTTEQRSKEIGVRKVLGASAFNITFLLTRDFTKYILFAFVIATPFSWFALNAWLNTYPYRISFPWLIIILSGLITILIAVTIVSVKAIKAARENPTRALRNE